MSRAMTDVTPIPHPAKPSLQVVPELLKPMTGFPPTLAFARGVVDGNHKTAIRVLPIQLANPET